MLSEFKYQCSILHTTKNFRDLEQSRAAEYKRSRAKQADVFQRCREEEQSTRYKEPKAHKQRRQEKDLTKNSSVYRKRTREKPSREQTEE